MTTQNQLNSSDLPLAGGTMSGAINMGGFGITSLLDPVNAQDAVTKNYADNIISGGAAPCVAASTTAFTVTYSNLAGTLTNAGTQATFSLDGQSPTVGQRVLIKNQATTYQNGIYTVTNVGSGATNWILTRALDYNTVDAINDTGVVPVTAGTVNASTGWINTTVMVAIGVTAITFVQFTSLITLPVSLANGGTNANLTANNGGIFYSTASAGAILAGTATAGQLLQSGATAAPSWLTGGNYGVLISNGSAAPSWLANGTTGQVLTATTSNTPSWAASTGLGSWVKITRTVASTSASVVFSSLSTTYQAYAVVLSTVIPVTNAVQLQLTYNSISSNYLYASSGILSGGATTSTSSASAAFILLTSTQTIANNGAGGLSGILYMYNPDTTNGQNVTWQTCYLENGGTVIVNISGGGFNTGTTAITSITFAMSSGNISSGVFELYGLVA